MRRDDDKHKRLFLLWKEKCPKKIPDISEENSRVILNYINDMEYGLNVGKSSKKGGRSYNRLYNLQQRMIFVTKLLEKIYGIRDLTKIEERHLHEFFTGMKNGEIKRVDGGVYQDPANFVKIFKTFWHWHQKVNRKRGIEIYDITQDLDTSVNKPKWVYLTEDEIKKLHDKAIYYYKALIMFLFDTGVRAPSELRNIKVSDLQNNYKELMIRDEISKTFGRRIKLMISSDIIKNYVENEGLSGDDYLFSRKAQTMNQYLQKLSKRVLGEEKTPAGQKYSELTMYDFRHCACCYWLPRYKSESALKYRFGWKKSDKIHYYSELLGMRDTITEEDMLMDIGKTELEKQLTRSENDKSILKERVEILERQMKVVAEMIRREIVVVGES
ncbi:site-specific integrase [Candidatus Pacearchaeota archaeon]|nr:site-specific integrase [Candidatus Pacearchaeota archaeon]